MSAAARSAAGMNHQRLMRGQVVEDHLVHALYLAQCEFDLIARGYTPAVAEVLAQRELTAALKAKAA